MGLILDLGAQKAEELQPAEENNEISTFKSAMAGLGSGLFKIPEGFISTGAMFYDLFNAGFISIVFTHGIECI